MNESPSVYIHKFAVDGSTELRAEQLRQALAVIPEIQRIDINAEKKLVRIIASRSLALALLNETLKTSGFHLLEVGVQTAEHKPQRNTVMHVGIAGMTCRSCELTIERAWRKLDGVKKVDVNAASGKARIVLGGRSPSIPELQKALVSEKYRVVPATQRSSAPAVSAGRPSLLQLTGLFALVFVIGSLLGKFGFLRPNVALGGETSFLAVFLLGLIAASSSCIAVSGGLLLSSAAKFNERYGGLSPLARMRPVLLFVGGRLASYAALGGVIGLAGKALSPSPLITGGLTVLAAVYMLVMGLEMLHLAPPWMKQLMPRMPKALSRRVLDAEGRGHPFMPLLLGGATFFLPCGFTQALQLYALTTGNAALSAGLLFAFALGTAPSLLALGLASSSLKGKAGRFFFRFSGALVVVLGLWNIQNGLTIAGYPLTLPSLSLASSEAATSAPANDPNVTVEDGVQVMKMSLDYGGYSPNQFTIKAGVPTRWEVDGTNAAGCLSVLQARQLGIRKLLAKGENVIEFTAPDPGTYTFSCSMGMYRGQINVVPNS